MGAWLQVFSAVVTSPFRACHYCGKIHSSSRTCDGKRFLDWTGCAKPPWKMR